MGVVIRFREEVGELLDEHLAARLDAPAQYVLTFRHSSNTHVMDTEQDTFGFLRILNQSPSDVHRTYHSSLIERMLQSTEERRVIREDGPLFR